MAGRGAETEIDAEGVALMTQAVMFEGYTVKDFTDITDANMDAAYGLAFNLVDNERYEEGEELFAWLTGLDHYQPNYLIGLGICRQMLKRYEGAINAYSTAAVLDVKNPIPPLRAAECYLALGDREKAECGLIAAEHWAGDFPQHAAVRERVAILREALQRMEAK